MRTVFFAVVTLLLGACQPQPAPAPSEGARGEANAATTNAATPSTVPSTSEPRSEPGTVPVTADNFIRAESDLYFSAAYKDGGVGKFHHRPDVTPLDKQNVIRMNRDTLYSSGLFDLDAGPVTITLPDPGKRFMSMQVISEDHYTPQVVYKPGTYTLTKDNVGTRYALAALRILVDPNNPDDVKQVHALQQAVKVEQASPGTFEVPKWDPVTQKRVRDALLVLASSLPDSRGAFGTKAEVDPTHRLIFAASAWGGNPDKDALYLNVTPERNDGKTVHKLHVGDVPVDGFWSISVYNQDGYFEANQQNAYTFNNLTAKHNDDDSVDIQFGGCDGQAPNCLPITPGWNYMVRLYRPRAEILSGKWKFPEAQPVGN